MRNLLTALFFVAFIGCSPKNGNPPNPAAYFADTDKNHDGKISYDEFSHNGFVPKGIPPEVQRNSTRMAFKLLDRNHDGYIDKEEYDKSNLKYAK